MTGAEPTPEVVPLGGRKKKRAPRGAARALARGPSGSRGRWLVPGLAALVVLLVLALAGQWSRNARLERQVVALEGELVHTRGQLESHRAHLGEVQTRVGDLATRFTALEELLERGPAQ